PDAPRAGALGRAPIGGSVAAPVPANGLRRRDGSGHGAVAAALPGRRRPGGGGRGAGTGCRLPPALAGGAGTPVPPPRCPGPSHRVWRLGRDVDRCRAARPAEGRRDPGQRVGTGSCGSARRGCGAGGDRWGLAPPALSNSSTAGWRCGRSWTGVIPASLCLRSREVGGVFLCWPGRGGDL
ncbi:hypothetical protein Nmel_008146, partial [Mimus melanotis]